MSKESHSFSVEVATKIGVNAAIVLQHFIHLTKATEREYIRKSRKALQEVYPYLSDKEIRNVLDKLEGGGYLESKIENEVNYDRTKSYKVTPEGLEIYGISPIGLKGQWIGRKGQSQDAERANDNSYNSYSSITNKQTRNSELETWLSDISTDQFIREAFTRARKVPSGFFQSYFELFTLEAKSKPETYHKRADVVNHFLSYSQRKYQIETAETKPQRQQPQRFTPEPSASDGLPRINSTVKYRDGK